MASTRSNLKRKRATFLTLPSQDIIQIKVLPDFRPFSFHKDLLRNYSEYFRVLFGGSCTKCDEQSIELPDVSEGTLRIYQQWLYGQLVNTDLDFQREKHVKIDSLPPHKFNPRPIKGEKPTAEDRVRWAEYDRFVGVLLDVYIMAERYDTALLRQDVMTLLHNYDRKFNLYPALANVPRAFEMLPHKSPFCLYLADSNAMYWKPGRDEAEYEGSLYSSLPRHFIMHVALINTQRCNSKRNHDWWLEGVKDVCTYHEHIMDEDKLVCKLRRGHDWYVQHDFFQACKTMAKTKDCVEAFPSVS